MLSASGKFAVTKLAFSFLLKGGGVPPAACHFQEDKQRRHLPPG